MNTKTPIAIYGEGEYVPIEKVRPSPENESIYKRIDKNDPQTISLLEDIRINKQLRAICITLDGYVLDGHRRLFVLLLLGYKHIRIVYYPKYRNEIPDEEYNRLLISFNEQRVKSVDEIIREELAKIDINPREAKSRFVSARINDGDGSLKTLEMGDKKNRSKISPAKKPMMDVVTRVVEELRPYWPITIRTGHYQVFPYSPMTSTYANAKPYQNDRASYDNLSNLLTRMRVEGMIPFECIRDDSREYVEWRCHCNPRAHLQDVVKRMGGYSRNLLQSQSAMIEVYSEKQTIENLLTPICSKYRLPIQFGKGFSSATVRRNMSNRFRQSGKNELVVLIFSDFDPDGESIAESFSRLMRDEEGVNITPVKVGLTFEQVGKLKLPPAFEAKKSSSNYKSFFHKYGSDAWEIDAVHPRELQTIFEDAIKSVIDIDLFNRELEQEEQDFVEIFKYSELMQKVLKSEVNP